MAKRTKKKKIKMKSGDFLLTILVLALVVFGVIMVFSASYYSSISETGDHLCIFESERYVGADGARFDAGDSSAGLSYIRKTGSGASRCQYRAGSLLFTPLGITRNNASAGWV